MADKNKAAKQYEEEEERHEKLSINSQDRGFEDELRSVNSTGGINEKTGINNTLEEDTKPLAKDDDAIPAELLKEEEPIKDDKDAAELEKNIKREEEEEEDTLGGLLIPEAKAKRDPKMDIDPLEEEDLGLEEGDFLADREVQSRDLEAHMELKKKGFLGSNTRRPREFTSIFDKGKSSKDDPKLDLGYRIHHNTPLKKELIAQQLLRNYHSKESSEVSNTKRIFQEFQLDEETLEAIKTDTMAHENEDLIEKLKNIIPSNL